MTCINATPYPPTALYLIGVDTGGTYTDAAIIEAHGHRIVATAKAITTKGDLAVGVREAISAALAKLPHTIAPERISMLSVSTTLATNAVVEGHGSATGGGSAIHGAPSGAVGVAVSEAEFVRVCGALRYRRFALLRRIGQQRLPRRGPGVRGQHVHDRDQRCGRGRCRWRGRR